MSGNALTQNGLEDLFRESIKSVGASFGGLGWWCWSYFHFNTALIQEPVDLGLRSSGVLCKKCGFSGFKLLKTSYIYQNAICLQSERGFPILLKALCLFSSTSCKDLSVFFCIMLRLILTCFFNSCASGGILSGFSRPMHNFPLVRLQNHSLEVPRCIGTRSSISPWLVRTGGRLEK